MERETFLRLTATIPLLIITAQVVLLSRILATRAWALLAVGFTIFAVLQVLAFFITFPVWIRLAGALVGYAHIAAGLFVFRRDLLAVLSPRRKP